MRRVSRFLFTVAAAVSAVLCAGVLALWAVTSDRTARLAYHGCEGEQCWWAFALASRGAVEFCHMRKDYAGAGRGPAAEARRAGWSSGLGQPYDLYADPVLDFATKRRAELFGLRVTARRGTYTRRAATVSEYSRQLVFPLWMATGLLLVMPTARLLRSRRCRQRERRATGLAAGLCPSCGRDLRTAPDRCLECGAAVGGTAGRDHGKPRAGATMAELLVVIAIAAVVLGLILYVLIKVFAVVRSWQS